MISQFHTDLTNVVHNNNHNNNAGLAENRLL